MTTKDLLSSLFLAELEKVEGRRSSGCQGLTEIASLSTVPKLKVERCPYIVEDLNGKKILRMIPRSFD